jgi:single-strand DNA-binding protein
MPNLNRVEVAGHLGRDVELRYAANGKAIANFSLGVSSKRGAGDAATEETYWANCLCFGKTAEIIAPFKKGHPFYVEGKLTEDKWTDKNTGQERRATKIMAFHVWPLERAPKGPQADTGEAGRMAAGATAEPGDENYQPF